MAAFLGGGLLTVLLVRTIDRVTTPALVPDPEPVAQVVASRESLEALLLPLAEWRRRDTTSPMAWSGTLPRSTSLVQWNARVSAAVEALGLQVLEGREEIVQRPRGLPLQRLTLVIGEAAGDVAATLVVELARPSSLPPAF